MLPIVHLAPGDVAPGRPFTDAVRTAEDLAVVHAMVAGLRHVLAGPLPGGPAPLVLAAPAPPGRQHRAIVCDAARLRGARPVAFVGFFAHKRPEVDASPLTSADDALVAEFPGHPGILSYSSLELPDGNWGNLIVLDRAESGERWRESERHAWAVGELAPRHYHWVRLHLGAFPAGVLAGAPALVRTRYLDYQGPEVWQAERRAAA
jgi:hypothetical protein